MTLSQLRRNMGWPLFWINGYQSLGVSTSTSLARMKTRPASGEWIHRNKSQTTATRISKRKMGFNWSTLSIPSWHLRTPHMMTVRMYFITTNKGAVFYNCYINYNIMFLWFWYTLYHSKLEMPCGMNHLQVSKSGIKLTPSMHGIFLRALSSAGLSQRGWKKARRKSVL